MVRKTSQLNMETDEMLKEPYALWDRYCDINIPAEYKCFASDVVSDSYTGEHKNELAMMCQCFFFSRLAHLLAASGSSVFVLLGDYFISYAVRYEKPFRSYRLLEKLSQFVKDEIEEMANTGALSDKYLKNELVLSEDYLARYRRFFTEICRAAMEGAGEKPLECAPEKCWISEDAGKGCRGYIPEKAETPGNTINNINNNKVSSDCIIAKKDGFEDSDICAGGIIAKSGKSRGKGGKAGTNAIVRKMAASGKFSKEFLHGLENALDEMEEELEKTCTSRLKDLQEGLLRVVTAGGKRLRPVLAYLGYMAGLAEKEKNIKSFDYKSLLEAPHLRVCVDKNEVLPESFDIKITCYPAVPLMVMAELVHTASLVHDDIVDKARVRRSVPTINATSGDEAAVQAGDYLMAKASGYLKYYDGLDIDRHFCEIALGMCLGEFSQIDSLFRYDNDSLSTYYTQIKRKTSNFISASLALGAVAAGASDETVKRLEICGENIGMAFQLKDDVLDYDSGKAFGKSCGQDIKRGIFTLPLIYALEDETGKPADCDLNRDDSRYLPKADGVTEKQTDFYDENMVNADAAAGFAAHTGSASPAQKGIGLKQLNEMRKLAVSQIKTGDDIKKLLNFVRSSGALDKVQENIEQLSYRAVKAIEPLAQCEACEALRFLAESLAVRSM